mmetsp:Transcript_10567/g.20346  ORF Transcript_10567/g.20346 Transcript_10567/m.20346 type:complete len:288 (+) Transcript_10567:2045-2908(+)
MNIFRELHEDIFKRKELGNCRNKMAGFAPVSSTPIISQLSSIYPQGNTAMRDSIILGIGFILQLNQALAQSGRANDIDFVHIVITDGVDNSSKASLQETMRVMLSVGVAIPKERCKTVIIGIDLSTDAEQQLVALTVLGFDTCEIYRINSINLSQIFDRIQVSLGIRRQTQIAGIRSEGVTAVSVQQRVDRVLMVNRKTFAVLFNLDVSGSMEGDRWSQVKNCVAGFLRNMSPTDIVAGICFNEQARPVELAAKILRPRVEQAPSQARPPATRIMKAKKQSCKCIVY